MLHQVIELRYVNDWSKGRPEPDKSAGKARIYKLKYPIAIMLNEATSWKVIDDTLMWGMTIPGPANRNTYEKQI